MSRARSLIEASYPGYPAHRHASAGRKSTVRLTPDEVSLHHLQDKMRERDPAGWGRLGDDERNNASVLTRLLSSCCA